MKSIVAKIRCAMALAALLWVAAAVEAQQDAPKPAPPTAAQPAEPAQPVEPEKPSPPATPPPSQPPPPPPPAAPAAPALPPTVAAPPPPAYIARPVEKSDNSTLGSLTRGVDKLQVELSPYGAGISTIRTTDYFTAANSADHYQIMHAQKRTDDQGRTGVFEYPFAGVGLSINGKPVSGVTADGKPTDFRNQRWAKVSDGVYRIVIADAAGAAVLEITRTYTLGQAAAGYDLTCITSFRNPAVAVDGKAPAPLEVVWHQNAQGDIAVDDDYRGDVRMVVAGYHDLGYDANRLHIATDDAKLPRKDLLSGPPSNVPVTVAFWPRDKAPEKAELVWFADSNRYFTLVTHRQVAAAQAGSRVQAPALSPQTKEPSQPKDVFEHKVAVVYRDFGSDRLSVFTLQSKPFTLAAGATHSIDLCLYAGPRSSDILNEEPYKTLQLTKNLVRYEFGCSWCLFQGLADFLLGFLKALHAVVQDWGLSIIILVLVVRILLHPITKKAQINMTRMQRMMSTLQPEMAKLKEKYKNDPQKQNAEMMRLYREKGVNPLGFLGCLPMFLQMPIWAALYAMLYEAIELRHQPAFWGFFQLFGDWNFLRDLSSQDNFIKFADGGARVTIPICNLPIYIPYAFNILPILMSVMFYLQQAMTTPPPANEEQRRQQQMMKWMTLIMFPLFLYGAPSGLTLYIMASSLAGMVDSYYVRKHIKAEEAAGTLTQPKKKGPGFFGRWMAMAEARMKEVEAKRKLQGGSGPKDRKRKR